MKSRNSSSSHLSTCANVLVAGRRRLPLALTNGRGAPVASSESAPQRQRNLPKNCFFRVARSSR